MSLVKLLYTLLYALYCIKKSESSESSCIFINNYTESYPPLIVKSVKIIYNNTINIAYLSFLFSNKTNGPLINITLSSLIDLSTYYKLLINKEYKWLSSSILIIPISKYSIISWRDEIIINENNNIYECNTNKYLKKSKIFIKIDESINKIFYLNDKYFLSIIPKELSIDEIFIINLKENNNFIIGNCIYCQYLWIINIKKIKKIYYLNKEKIIINNTILAPNYMAEISLNIWSNLLSFGDTYTFNIYRREYYIPQIIIPSFNNNILYWHKSNSLILIAFTYSLKSNNFFNDYIYKWNITFLNNNYYTIYNKIIIPQYTFLSSIKDYFINLILYDSINNNYSNKYNLNYIIKLLPNKINVGISGGNRVIPIDILDDKVGIKIILDSSFYTFNMDDINITNKLINNKNFTYIWQCDGIGKEICNVSDIVIEKNGNDLFSSSKIIIDAEILSKEIIYIEEYFTSFIISLIIYDNYNNIIKGNDIIKLSFNRDIVVDSAISNYLIELYSSPFYYYHERIRIISHIIPMKNSNKNDLFYKWTLKKYIYTNYSDINEKIIKYIDIKSYDMLTLDKRIKNANYLIIDRYFLLKIFNDTYNTQYNNKYNYKICLQIPKNNLQNELSIIGIGCIDITPKIQIFIFNNIIIKKSNNITNTNNWLYFYDIKLILNNNNNNFNNFIYWYKYNNLFYPLSDIISSNELNQIILPINKNKNINITLYIIAFDGYGNLQQSKENKIIFNYNNNETINKNYSFIQCKKLFNDTIKYHFSVSNIENILISIFNNYINCINNTLLLLYQYYIIIIILIIFVIKILNHNIYH